MHTSALDPLARRRIMTVLFMGVFMAAIDSAVIAPAIPALRAAFGVPNTQIGMVTIVFSLFIMGSTTLMAALSDRYGRRPVYLLCVAGFALGSLVTALAPAFWVVLLGRAIQGFSAGGINPVASAVVGDAFPPEERGKALGMIGGTFGMAFVLGPLLASLILIVLTWHWIFLINLPVAAVVIWLGLRNLPHAQPHDDPPPLDWAGIIIMALALVCLVLGINRVLDQLLELTLWPFLLAGAALGLVLLIAVERRAARPVAPLHFFTNRQLALTYILCIGAGFGMGSVIFIASIAVEGLGVPAEQAGMLLIPLVIASAAASMGFGRLLNTLGSRLVMLIGFGTLAVGAVLLSLTSPALGMWLFLPATLLVGLGVGVTVGGTLRTIILNEVRVEERGAAQGLVNVAISIGSLLVAAILSTLADTNGGGMAGLSVAYAVAAGVTVLMFFLTLGLHPHGEVQRTPELSRA